MLVVLLLASYQKSFDITPCTLAPPKTTQIVGLLKPQHLPPASAVEIIKRSCLSVCLCICVSAISWLNHLPYLMINNVELIKM